jgi:hypothetical protein
MNKKPQHVLSQSGSDSWRKFKNSASPGLEYQHNYCLLAAIVDVSKPVFMDLASGDLLKRCLCGTIQNRCECVNSIIWIRIPNLFL